MTPLRRTRDRLTDILNGDWERLELNTKRALGIIADEQDGLHEDLRGLREEMKAQHSIHTKSIDDLRKTMLAVGGTFGATLLGAAVTVFFTR